VVGVALAVVVALYVGSIVKIQSYWHDDVAFFSRAVEVAPDLVQNRLDLANALDSAGNYGEAARVLESAVPLTPNDAHLHLKLAREYQKLGRVLDFEREFRKFAQLSAAMAESKDAASDAAEEKPAP
jgi:tetratricopeptide (TPR) repeat protein